MNSNHKAHRYQKILALLFLFFIFYIGSATLPQTLTEIGQMYQKDEPNILVLRDRLEGNYRNMLTLEAPSPLKNKGAFIDFNGLLAKAMGQRKMNHIVKLDNGHLIGMTAVQEVDVPARRIATLCQKQRERGKDFLFILAPYQVSKYTPGIPAGYEDFSNDNADRLLAALTQAGVPYLDLREKMQAQGLSHDDAYFTTDHHWKPATGLWAYREIIQSLTAAGAIGAIDPRYTDAASFETREAPDAFLGATGRRTGQYYAGVDAFDIITPRFETNLTATIPATNRVKTGDFADTVLEPIFLETPKSLFLSNLFSFYGNGDRDFAAYQNPGAPIDKKALFIGDSFGNIPFAFLTLCFQSCEELDMRYYAEDFAAYYDDYAPDVLLLMINAGSIEQENTLYDFFPEAANE